MEVNALSACKDVNVTIESLKSTRRKNSSVFIKARHWREISRTKRAKSSFNNQDYEKDVQNEWQGMLCV
jgi:hypothetical protein